MRNARRETRRGSVNLGLLVALLATALAVLAAGCGSGDDSATGASGGGSLDVVGYSTPESVYEEALEPGFKGTSAGADVSFSNSFGASGDQSRAVEAGQPAAVVHFQGHLARRPALVSGKIGRASCRERVSSVV